MLVFLVNFSAGCCVFKDFSILLRPNLLYLHNYCIGSVGLVFYKKQKNNTFMKKLFSIVCAAVMVLSASAAPQFATRAAKTAVAELNTLPAAEMLFGHNLLVSTPASAGKKAPAMVSDGKIVADQATAFYYEETEDNDATWAFTFFTSDGNQGATVMVAATYSDKIAGTHDITAGQVVVAAGDTTTTTSGTLVITYAAPNYHFSLNATCANGHTYTMELDYPTADFRAINFYAYYLYQMGYGEILGIDGIEDCLIELDDAPFVVTGKTIDIVIPGVSILTDNTASTQEAWFEFSGQKDNYYVVLDILSSTLVGKHGNDEFDFDYTAIYVVDGENETKIACKSYDTNTATITINGDTTIADANIMGKDGNNYHVVMKYYIPTPTKFIDVTFAGTVDTETYKQNDAIIWEAQNEDYVMSLILFNDGAGTYTFDDIVGMNNTSYSYFGDLNTKYVVDIISATIVLAADNSFTAQFISTDARQFNITFTPSMTALSNTTTDEAKALKVVRNGQLVIIKNGVEYNALGAQLQ